MADIFDIVGGQLNQTATPQPSGDIFDQVAQQLTTPTPAPTAVAESGEEDGFLAKINAALRKPTPYAPLRHFEEATRENIMAMAPHDLPSYLKSILGPAGTAYEQGKALAQGDVGSIPLVGRVPEIIEAEETPAFSKERIGTAERTVMDLLALAGAGAKPRIPLRVEPTLAERIRQPRVEAADMVMETLPDAETQALFEQKLSQAQGPPETPPGAAEPPPPGAPPPPEQPSRAGPPPEDVAQAKIILERNPIPQDYVAEYSGQQPFPSKAGHGISQEAWREAWNQAERVSIQGKLLKPGAGDASTYERIFQGKPSEFTGEPPQTPPIEPPVPPVPEAELPYTPEGKGVTGIKHAITAAERETIGLPPAEQAARRGFGEVWDEAEAVATRDKERSRALVDEINKEPRALTDLEDALLLRRQIETKTEHARALEEANAKPGDEYAQARLDRARDEVQHVYNAAEVSGTETGRGLNARKMLADEDYSLANMEAELRAVVNKGEPLTPTQLKEVKKLHDDIVDWEAKYQKRVLRDIERYEQRVREGDTSPLRPSARTPREAETIELLRKREEAKMGYRRMIHEEKLRNEDAFAKTRRGLGEIQRTVRATKTAYDVSAVLRQGGFEFLSHPIEATIRLKPMVEAAASEKGQFRIMQEMRNDTETWSAAQRAKVFFSDPANPILARREELFASSVADKIPGVAMSERAYVTLLNKIRFDRFKAMRETLPKGGKPTAIEDQLIANFVNETTGRGNVGRHGGSMDTLNQVFFATRYNIARFQTLLGHPLWYKAGKGTWRVRRAIGKEYLRALRGMGLVIGAVTGAGVYGAGGTIEPDPRSSDFGKLKVGDRRYDLTLGMGQAATFLSRIFMGSTKTAEGEIRSLRGDVPFGQGTASDVIWRYLRGKAAPGLGAGINVAEGQKVTGQPTSAIQELLELPFPMSGGEAVDALQAEGVPAKLAGVLAAQLGMGVQSYGKQTTATRNAVRDRLEARDLALMRGDIAEATRLTKEMIMREPAETTEEGNLARQIRKQEAKAARQRKKLREQEGG